MNFNRGEFLHSLALLFYLFIFTGCSDPQHVNIVRVDHIKSITSSSINPHLSRPHFCLTAARVQKMLGIVPCVRVFTNGLMLNIQNQSYLTALQSRHNTIRLTIRAKVNRDNSAYYLDDSRQMEYYSHCMPGICIKNKSVPFSHYRFLSPCHSLADKQLCLHPAARSSAPRRMILGSGIGKVSPRRFRPVEI